MGVDREIRRKFNRKKGQPKTGFACIGAIRGWCGTIHTSFEAACNCRNKDSKSCRKTGGYSDRIVYRVEDSELIDAVPHRRDPMTGEWMRSVA